MTEFYTNLPPKEINSLEETIRKLTTTTYETDYQFNVGEYDGFHNLLPPFSLTAQPLSALIAFDFKYLFLCLIS